MLTKIYRPLSMALQATQLTPMFPTSLMSPRLMTPTWHSPVRQLSFRFPKEYQQPVSNKFRLFYVLRHHWELKPLLFAIATKILLVFTAIYAGIYHRVDVQLTEHNWNCISRNMDLRNPTIHKHLTINQKYEPWPEMQDVLDKMAEKEASFVPCKCGSCKT